MNRIDQISVWYKDWHMTNSLMCFGVMNALGNRHKHKVVFPGKSAGVVMKLLAASKRTDKTYGYR